MTSHRKVAAVVKLFLKRTTCRAGLWIATSFESTAASNHHDLMQHADRFNFHLPAGGIRDPGTQPNHKRTGACPLHKLNGYQPASHRDIPLVMR